MPKTCELFQFLANDIIQIPPYVLTVAEERSLLVKLWIYSLYCATFFIRLVFNFNQFILKVKINSN